jgi:hypothetical protein
MAGLASASPAVCRRLTKAESRRLISTTTTHTHTHTRRAASTKTNEVNSHIHTACDVLRRHAARPWQPPTSCSRQEGQKSLFMHPEKSGCRGGRRGGRNYLAHVEEDSRARAVRSRALFTTRRKTLDEMLPSRNIESHMHTEPHCAPPSVVKNVLQHDVQKKSHDTAKKGLTTSLGLYQCIYSCASPGSSAYAVLWTHGQVHQDETCHEEPWPQTFTP